MAIRRSGTWIFYLQESRNRTTGNYAMFHKPLSLWTVANMLAMLCTNYLWDLLPSRLRGLYPFAIADLSTALSEPRRLRVLRAMRSGTCRILIATELAGMRVDFPDVERVIQWGVPPTLTIGALWQRFGRFVNHRDRTCAVALTSPLVKELITNCIIPELKRLKTESAIRICQEWERLL
jgi:superfamily II DNA/RNA helicase